MKHLVAVYDTCMAYGGSEEGGWWYDRGTLIRIVRTFANEEKAFCFARRLNYKLRSRVFGPNAGKHSYTSVLSEGELSAQVFEDRAPLGFPESRPRYE